MAEARYRILTIVRHYAWKQLEAAGELLDRGW